MADREFIINEVERGNTWRSQRLNKEFQDYSLKLHDPETGGETLALLTQVPETPAPRTGQRLFGHIENQYGREKFKKAQRDGQQSFSSNGRRSTQESSRIERQHSQEMAIRYFALAGKADGLALDALRPVIDWFQADVSRAVAQPTQLPDVPSDVPAPTPVAQAPVEDPDDLPF